MFGPRCRLPLVNIKLAAEQRLRLNVPWHVKRQVGLKLAVPILLSYSSADLDACSADWASLDLGICQRILGTDMQTLCKGAQLCQAWLAATKGLGPRRMDFSTDNFGSLYEPDLDQAESDRHDVLDLIHHQAEDTLEDLTIRTAYDLRDGIEAMQDICNILSEKSFPLLTILRIEIRYLRDWKVFTELPVTVKSLCLGYLLSKENYAPVGECFDLACFNHLVSLEELSLVLEGGDEVHSEVTGDLVLPALRSCRFEREDLDFRQDETYDILLTGFTAEGLPDFCLIMADQGVSCQLCSGKFVWTVVEQFLPLSKDDDVPVCSRYRQLIDNALDAAYADTA